MKSHRIGPFALLGPLIFCSSLSAQTDQPLSVQASGLVHQSYDESLRWEWGGEGQVRWTRGSWSLGAGARYTVSMQNEEDGSAPSFEYHVSTLGLFLEPRLVFITFWNRFGLYIHARIGVTGISEKESGTSPVLDQMGAPTGILEPFSVEGTSIAPEANFGPGLLIRLTRRVNLDMGGTVGYARWGERVQGRPGWYEFVGGRVGLVIGIG